MNQKIIQIDDDYSQIDVWFRENGVKRLLLVCDSAFRFLKIKDFFENVEERLKIEIYTFNDFSPNPLYESVEKGVKLFNSHSCDSIFAVGGGSAIDVAKCIKLYRNMDKDINFFEQDIVSNHTPFIAMPTTAGTGSEATRYAVIYYHGEKQNITHESCLPDTVLMDSGVLRTLPFYQKKATMLDALCHAVESYWSVSSTDESKKYSREAIVGIVESMEGYLSNTDDGNAQMMQAAHNAGKAINIAQTTAGHAMCYKITSLFGCAHGHAAALCDRVLFPWMIQNIDKCIDSRGEEYLRLVLKDIAEALGCADVEEGAAKFRAIVEEMGLDIPRATKTQFEELRTSVNLVRLKNYPLQLDEETIDMLYHEILLEDNLCN